VDTLTLNQLTFSANGALTTLLSPLVAIVLLYMMFKLPIHLSRVAMLGGVTLGGGFASRAVSYAAGSQMRSVAEPHLPGSLGGQSEPTQLHGPSAGRMRSAAMAVGAAAGFGAGAGAADAMVRSGAPAIGVHATNGVANILAGAAANPNGSNGTGDGRAYTPPALVPEPRSGSQSGLQAPAYNEERHLGEIEHAQVRSVANPVTVADARDALRRLSPEARAGAQNLATEHGPGAQEHFAYQATGEWWPDQRDAWRTLAAASPQVRAGAFDDATDAHRESPPSGGVGAPVTLHSATGAGADSLEAPEGHSREPRAAIDGPDSDADRPAGSVTVGGAAVGTDPGSGAPSVDPRSPDHVGGRSRPATTDLREATSSGPPRSEKTFVRPPREPRDPNPDARL
jgi:hypothetical protein